ncbi:unnamed protein product [Calypogeia fissa]
MAEDIGDKAKRVRALLSSFYGQEEVLMPTPRRDTLQGINEPYFDSDRYIESLLQRTPLDGLLQKHVEMAAEIKNLDSDMQMLVYENYNKFISATDTIKRMKENVTGIETNMDQLLETVTAVRGKSDGINVSLSARRERIEELNGTRSLLRKVQFIFDLPKRLRTCLKIQDYAKATKFYKGALPILKAYGTTSFVICKKEADEVIAIVSQKLESQVLDINIHLETRAEAVKLLQELDHPIQKMVDMYLATHWERLMSLLQVVEPETRGLVGHLHGWLDPRTHGRPPTHTEATEDLHKVFIDDFAETASIFRVLFPDQEHRLTEATIKLLEEYLASVQSLLQPSVGIPSVQELAGVLDMMSQDTDKMQSLVPEAGVSRMTAKVVETAVHDHITAVFTELYGRIKGALFIGELPSIKEGRSAETPKPLRAALDNAKRVILFDSVEVLRDLRDLLVACGNVLENWRDAYIDLVQAGFQDLFTKLNGHFHHLSSISQDNVPAQKSQGVSLGLILILALISVYIQQTAVPKITELIGVSFVGGGAMGFEARPAFVPSEICRVFHASGEKLLHEYIDTQSRKCSVLLRKSIETPNWLKYKEPRDVRMFADLLLQEVNRVQSEVQQLLDHGITRGHQHTDSTGSAGSSRSNSTSLRDNTSIRDSSSIHEGRNPQMSISNRARGQALERDVAKLFKQKVELFTKAEFTQVSVMSTIIKMGLKTFQECVRLQTFNRSGYNQIQLDVQYLRGTLRDKMIDEAVIDSLLDEVCTAAAERCIDPIPLEAAILDKLIDAKRAKQV